MQKTIFYIEMFAPTIFRVGMSIVVIWFGSQELLYPVMWASYIPDSAVALSHLSANILVHLNGAFEVIFGLALFFGIRTRITALLLALHMFGITYVVGYSAVGMRDFGLSIALLAIFMHGSSPFSVDMFKKNNKEDNLSANIPK